MEPRCAHQQSLSGEQSLLKYDSDSLNYGCLLNLISQCCVTELVYTTSSRRAHLSHQCTVMDSSNMRCYCGKSFHQLNAFSNHQGHCKSSKERLSLALSKAQQIWNKKRADKRLRILRDDTDGGDSSFEVEKAGQPSRIISSQTPADGFQNSSPEPEDRHITLEETVSSTYIYSGLPRF